MTTIHTPEMLIDPYHGVYAVDVDLGMAYPLTDCCRASGKGSGDGVVCRACYQSVDDRFGMSAEFGPGFLGQVAWMMPVCTNVVSGNDCSAGLAWDLDTLYTRATEARQK